jgi:putative flippase GtrA
MSVRRQTVCVKGDNVSGEVSHRMIAQLQESLPITQHKGLRQFVKFGIVGVSSMVVNFVFLNLLYYKAHLWLLAAVTLAFVLSVCNGFIWNRRWTFKEARQHTAHEQYVRFLAVNIVGWFLNTSIMVLIISHFASHGTGGIFGDLDGFKRIAMAVISGSGKHQYPPLLVNGSQLAAACVVVFWNFFANRRWTFKH